MFPHVDITHDVNGDDRDDLVIPDADGFWVFVQVRDGVFADPVKLGPSTEVDRLYGPDEYRYTPWNQSRIHEIDYNRDGRKDLVFWNTDHFKIHSQSEYGLFATDAETFTTDVRLTPTISLRLLHPMGFVIGLETTILPET